MYSLMVLIEKLKFLSNNFLYLLKKDILEMPELGVLKDNFSRILQKFYKPFAIKIDKR